MTGVLLFTLITLILSISIVLLNKYLFNEKSKVDEIEKSLPGYNCGACGYGSCSGMAEALLKDKDAINKCRLTKSKEEILKLLEE